MLAMVFFSCCGAESPPACLDYRAPLTYQPCPTMLVQIPAPHTIAARSAWDLCGLHESNSTCVLAEQGLPDTARSLVLPARSHPHVSSFALLGLLPLLMGPTCLVYSLIRSLARLPAPPCSSPFLLPSHLSAHAYHTLDCSLWFGVPLALVELLSGGLLLGFKQKVIEYIKKEALTLEPANPHLKDTF